MKVLTHPSTKLSQLTLAALTAIEVIAVTPAHASLTPIAIYYGAGSAIDVSPNRNNGTFSGLYEQDAFNLATGSFTAPDISAYNLQKYSGYTLSLWFNYNGTPATLSNGTFLGQDNGSGERPKWFLAYDYSNPGPANNKFTLHFNNDGSNPRVFLTSNLVSPPISGWHQLVVTKEARAVDFYFDGNNVGTTLYGGITPDPSAPLTMGTLEACCGFRGLMSDIALYEEAESASQVLQAFEAGRHATPATEPTSNALVLLACAILLCFSRRRTEVPSCTP